MNNQLSNELEERFLHFGVSVIKLTQAHKSTLPFSVIDQVIRSSTSIGANYSEAQNASSKADFRNKIYTAKKEASETRYWLRVVSELTDRNVVEQCLKEVLLILQKIVNTLREKSAT
jgi:four helix bundle protein